MFGVCTQRSEQNIGCLPLGITYCLVSGPLSDPEAPSIVWLVNLQDLLDSAPSAGVTGTQNYANVLKWVLGFKYDFIFAEQMLLPTEPSQSSV